jgi:hypothetical protein
MQRLWLIRLEDEFVVLCNRHFIELVESGGQPKPITIHPDLYRLFQRGCDRCRIYSFDGVARMLQEEGWQVESIESDSESSDPERKRLKFRRKPLQ